MENNLFSGIDMTKTFREWFMNDYVMKSPLSSTLLTGNKAINERQERICKVPELIINNPNMNSEDIRRKIATDFFVTLRCALDYITYAHLFINIYNKKKP